MSAAEYREKCKRTFNGAYERVLAKLRAPRWGAAGDSEASLHEMKVEFDAAQALVRDLSLENDWVRNVLAERGYSGPLCEGTCPLREWLQPAEPVPMPNKFTEYAIDYTKGSRLTFFDKQDVLAELDRAFESRAKYTFETNEHVFADEWKFACNMVRQGASISAVSIHALKLGTAAGMVLEL
jgi:hypothetical protein